MSRQHRSDSSWVSFTIIRFVCGEPQRAGQLGGTYSLWSLSARMVGFPGGLGLARPEVSEAEGGRLVTQFCPELSWQVVVQGEQRAREDLGDPMVLLKSEARTAVAFSWCLFNS